MPDLFAGRVSLDLSQTAASKQNVLRVLHIPPPIAPPRPRTSRFFSTAAAAPSPIARSTMR